MTDSHEPRTDAGKRLLRKLGDTPRPYADASQRGSWDDAILAIEAEARSSHKHGDQDCDPSEAAAIAQWERDEGPLPHYLVGLDCWCHPYRDTAEPEVIIHREDARA